MWVVRVVPTWGYIEGEDANSTKTPLPAGIHLEKSEEPVALDTKTYYQQIIGTLIYAAIGTRPDIAFVATRLSRFNNNPTEEHIKYARYIQIGRAHV